MRKVHESFQIGEENSKCWSGQRASALDPEVELGKGV